MALFVHARTSKVRAWCMQSACKVRARCVQGACKVCACTCMVCACTCMVRMVRACVDGLREGPLEQGEVALQLEVLDRLDRDHEDGHRVDDERVAVTFRERTELLMAQGSICRPMCRSLPPSPPITSQRPCPT